MARKRYLELLFQVVFEGLPKTDFEPEGMRGQIVKTPVFLHFRTNSGPFWIRVATLIDFGHILIPIPAHFGLGWPP